MNKHHTTRKKVTVTIAIFLAILVVFIPLTQAATLNLTYDANGNLITGDGKYRVYNNQNQLTTLYNGSNTSGIILQKFAYHPTEERVLWKKTYAINGSLIETVVYVSGDYVQIINNSGTFNYTYIQANGKQIGQILPDGKKQFILDNIKGSSTVTTNSTGGVVERTSYTPYGGVISGGVSSRFNYEARENDQIASDTDFRFRKYQPEWGIFTQPDSVIQNIYDPQSLNRYSFERNNPEKNKDSTGHDSVEDFFALIGMAFLFGAIAGATESVFTQLVNTHRIDVYDVEYDTLNTGMLWSVGAISGTITNIIVPEAIEGLNNINNILKDINSNKGTNSNTDTTPKTQIDTSNAQNIYNTGERSSTESLVIALNNQNGLQGTPNGDGGTNYNLDQVGTIGGNSNSGSGGNNNGGGSNTFERDLHNQNKGNGCTSTWNGSGYNYIC